jgi:Ca2+-binding RTX toxin-like protein
MTIISRLTHWILILGGAGADTLRGECGNGTDVLNSGAERLRNWNGATCAVLFGREKCEAANDVEGRLRA